MKKVLFVATVVKSHINVFHLPYLKWFKDNGYQTHVCAKNDYENKSECTIPFCDYYYDLPFERSPFKKNNIKTYKQLKRIIEMNNFDIIHCHTPMGGALTRLAARDARKNSSVIYTAHGLHFYKGAPITNWLLYYPVERWLSRHTDVLITINKEDYSRAQKFKAKKIDYVPGVGIDTGKYCKLIVDNRKKRNELGIKKEDFIILSVGELNKNKNHEIIIKAIAETGRSDLTYLICGVGPLENYLKELSERLGIEKQVKLIGYRKDIFEISKIANVFAFPSFREGLSLSLMEAMSSELPVVCSNIRGNCDLIQERQGGYLLEPNDLKGFADALQELVGDASQRNLMGKYNKGVIKKFDIKHVTKDLEKIYFEV